MAKFFVGQISLSLSLPSDGVVAEYPFHYGIMNARGFVSPYILKDGRCTFCRDNPLTGGIFPNLIVDHIYITTDTTERVLFAKVSLK